MKRAAKVVVSIIGAVLLIAVVLVVHSFAMGPAHYSTLTSEFFEGCPPDEIRIGCKSSRNWWDTAGEVRLKESKYVEIRDAGYSHSGSTMDMARGQLKKVQELRDELPNAEKWSFQWYDFKDKLYVAFWRDGRRVIESYPLDHLPKEVDDFLTASHRDFLMQIYPEAEYSEHGL